MATPLDLLSAKIALLSLLTDLPEPPSINESSRYTKGEKPQPDRTLPFKHEVSITQHLAFICAYSDSPLHVLAICVEEAVTKDSLMIRLAVNTGKHEVLINGLKVMSQILQDEATNGAVYPKNNILEMY